MNVAELLVKCLESEGIEFIFGVPGEENEAFLFALEKSNIRFITTRHEQGAAFIANVMGRLTQKAGVCLSTLGPGATNLITGLADAQLDRAPVVAITAQNSLERAHHENHHKIDVVELFAPIVKWNGVVTNAKSASEIVRQAFKKAQAEKPGTTHIELPENIAKIKVEDEDNCMFSPLGESNDTTPSHVAPIFEQLQKSKRPLIMAGNGVVRANASEALCQLAEKFNIPFINTFRGKGVMSVDNELYIGTVGLEFKDFAAEALDAADLILAVGYDLVEYDPGLWNCECDKNIVHIDSNTTDVYKEYVPKLESIGNIKNIIDSTLNETTFNKSFDSWHTDIKERVQSSIDSFKPLTEDEEKTVPGILHAVREILPKDSIILSDVGTHKMWIARNFPVYYPNTCVISNGMSSMGIALPGLIASNVVFPDKKVVSLMGDGGALMNFQELETAARTGCAGVIIVFKDDNYGSIDWKQRMNEGKSFGTQFGNPDFVELASSFGIEAHSPKDYAEFKSIFSQALSSNKLTLLEIEISNEPNTRLTEALDAYFSKSS